MNLKHPKPTGVLRSEDVTAAIVATGKTFQSTDGHYTVEMRRDKLQVALKGAPYAERARLTFSQFVDQYPDTRWTL